ncbi:aromatic ring hydroxylase [Gordonia sp. TBRC 11910]|uniref:Aromatic ring hydroxylase n=1 Tax=Gordonia asplenii TaxID=2725283 RepID=A0A848L7V6_9ACTN|nr:FAD-dependent monooxygenase [Gordonia asplenii]NMO03658.1 aromatic ring hydroxylase [Gordonia asplenii]
MSITEVPVLIVGGGGCGLAASIFLSDLNIDHLVIERRLTGSGLPKAHYLNQRTMEIFRQHALADAIYEVGTPIEKMGSVNWATSLGGDGPLDRRSLGRLDAFGGGALRETYSRDSPCLSSNYPQSRLEPLLRDVAEERGPGRVRFHHELTRLRQDSDGVTASVTDLDSRESYSVRAQYVIAADGGKTVGPMSGIEMTGQTGLLDMISVHFSADLSGYYDDADMMTWLINPDGWDGCGLVQMGPTWGAQSEEWVLNSVLPPDDPARNEHSLMPDRVRGLLKLPDLEMRVHRINSWIIEGVVAERYQDGRIFLAGDAAHRHPPTTGLGLNTAFQDAHNLAWKLAAVLSGQASAALLATYAAERQPIGTRNVDWAMFTFFNHLVLDPGFGLLPGAAPEQNVQALAAFFADDPMGQTRRARAAHVLDTQRTEFQAHDLEIGFSYDVGALIPDGTERPERDPMGATYRPSTRPGHRLPHAWLEHDGRRLSTHDLSPHSSGFALITGPDGDAWLDAARQAADRFGIQLTAIKVGEHGEYLDTDGRWRAVCQISDAGAVLIRPDKHIAWRISGAPEGSHVDALIGALTEILRPAPPE